MIAEVLAYGAVMALVVRPALCKWAVEHVRKHSDELSLYGFAAILVMVYISAMITNLIGIFSIFGGFAMGAILFDQVELRKATLTRLNDFVTVFFLPVFFTYTGLRTDMGSMQGALLWSLCGLVLLTATAGKPGGCMLAAEACGVSWRESAMIGALMNTRGLMELIVINIGYDLGIIPKTVFFMLVMMAVLTTFMTSPIMSQLMQGRRADDPAALPRLAANT
jgi:Kef-type K+ transport system membrane component KefB